MDNTADTTKYVEFPHEGAVTPERPPELTPELYKQFKTVFYGELVNRMMSIANIYGPKFALDMLNKQNILLNNDETWAPFASQINRKIEEYMLTKQQKKEQKWADMLEKAAAKAIYFGDHIEKKIVQNEVGHVDSGGAGIVINQPE